MRKRHLRNRRAAPLFDGEWHRSARTKRVRGWARSSQVGLQLVGVCSWADSPHGLPSRPRCNIVKQYRVRNADGTEPAGATEAPAPAPGEDDDEPSLVFPGLLDGGGEQAQADSPPSTATSTGTENGDDRAASGTETEAETNSGGPIASPARDDAEEAVAPDATAAPGEADAAAAPDLEGDEEEESAIAKAVREAFYATTRALIRA